MKKDHSPDPGTYHKEDYFGKNAKSITLKGKSRDLSKSEVPGPGSYDPSLKPAIKGVNLASSAKPVVESDLSIKLSSLLPGPG